MRIHYMLLPALTILYLCIAPVCPAQLQAQGLPAAGERLPTLYLLAVGIDDYGPTFPRLAGAVSDAQALANALPGAGYEHSVVVLTNAEATESRLRNEVERIQSTSQPSDLFVFHFSGMGQTGQEGGMYLASERGEIALLSGRTLREWTSSLPVRQSLFIFDTVDGQFILNAFLEADEAVRAREGAERSVAVLASIGMGGEERDPVSGVVHGSLTRALLGVLGAVGADPLSSADLLAVRDTAAHYYKRDKPPGGWFLEVLDVVLRGPDFPIRTGETTPASALPPSPPAGDRDGPSVALRPTVAVMLEGRVNDPAGVRELLIGGRQVPVPQDGIIRIPVGPGEGRDSVEVRAVDGLGNETAVWVSLLGMRSDVVGASAATTTSFVRTGRDIALIIATNTYEYWSNLANPVVDARAVAAELEGAYGFEVHLLIDPTRNQVRDTVASLARDSQFSDEDQLFIFFAGHGAYSDEALDGFLAFRDTRPASEDRYGDSGLRYSWLRDTLTDASAKHVFLVIDACFGGSFSERLGIGSSRGDPLYALADPAQIIQRRLQYTTRRYLTSGSLEYVPDGRPGQHSPFARRFLEALRTEGGPDGNGVLTFSEISAFVELVSATEPRGGSFPGDEPGSDFMFIRR